MKFKTDENLPIEVAQLLVNSGHDTKTVNEQQLQGAKDFIIFNVCNNEQRILVTLDLDFADINIYPPQKSPGIIVLRVGSHAKKHVLKIFQRIILLITHETVKNRLWIVEENKIRIRGETD